MTETRLLSRVTRRTTLVLCAVAVAVGAWAQDGGPLIAIDLPGEGAQYEFGGWLEDALRDEGVRVTRPQRAAEAFADEPACVVTWSEPRRGSGETRRLRRHVRSGGGLVYVVGEGERHLRRARTFLGPLDIDVRPLDGGAGAADWGPHPLTEGSPDLGAVNAGTAISGAGGSPLIRTGGRQIAVAFDWGPLGRAVILDQSVLFDQLHEASPRPAVRDFLVRAALWTARADEDTAAAEEPRERPHVPSIEELIGEQAAAPVTHRTAILDLPDGDRDNWNQIRRLLRAELERAEIDLRDPRRSEGEALLSSGTLEGTGLIVLGSGRESDEIHWSEPMALGWFFERGGRILAIPHAAGGSMGRMVGFNEMLTQLRIAVSLGRDNGRAHLAPHPITRRIRMPEDGLGMREGAQVWAPLTEPLVTVRNRPAAASWQSGEGRIVIIDGQLLLSQRGEDEPYDEMVTLLRNSIQWLMGDL